MTEPIPTAPQTLVSKLANLVAKVLAHDKCLHFIMSIVIFLPLYQVVNLEWAVVVSIGVHIIRKLQQIIQHGRRDWMPMATDVLAGVVGTLFAWALTLEPMFTYV